MRIISQDGMVDVPYEQVLLGICDQNNKQEYVIYAYTNNPRPYFIATYSTEAKALKAMEMLRTEYRKYIGCDGGMLATANFYVQPFAFNQPKVFQFPSDEEIEA